MSEVIAGMKRKNEMKAAESLRQDLEHASKSRLADADAEVQATRIHVRQILQSSLLDGRLSDVISSIKRKREAANLESMRGNLKEMFKASVLDGRLNKALAYLKHEKVAKEAEAAKQEVRAKLEASLTDGSLAEVMRQVKREREAKAQEQMRQDMMSTMKAGVMDGRLSQILAQVTEKRKSTMAPNCPGQVTVAPQPSKPTSPKTTARPQRRSDPSKKVETAAITASSTASASMPNIELRESVPASLLASAGLPRSMGFERPQSPAGPLPPVTPPSKKSLGFRSPRPSAMELDLGIDLSSGCRKSSGSTPRSRSLSSTTACLERSTNHKVSQTASAMVLDLGPSSRPLSRGASIPKLGTGEKTLKLSKLPPLPFKSSPMKHPSHVSMDSLVWGVAPVSNRLEWAH
jgi:hypothetical protein